LSGPDPCPGVLKNAQRFSDCRQSCSANRPLLSESPDTMTPIIEDSVLGSDLNCSEFSLSNLGGLDPLPPNLAQSDDPRLTDAREPLPGSVTNASVAPGAAIAQSKLDLSGPIPPAWLGTTADTAARGDLAEYLSNKGQPGGYAALDGSGKVPSAQLPAAVGTGTVTSVGLSMPGDFIVSGSPMTGAGPLSVAWDSVADLSWFGNKAGAPGPPQFYTSPLPPSLIPNLDASMVTTGVLGPALLPVAVRLAVSHAPGAVPDPGDGSAGALATDYLARDMSYKPKPSLGPTYQPTIPNPVLNISSNLTGPVTVSPSTTPSDVIFFYSLVGATSDFVEFPGSGYISLPGGDTVWVYAAHAGYNN